MAHCTAPHISDWLLVVLPCPNQIAWKLRRRDLNEQYSTVNHGRQNGFESGTAEGIEHETPKAANQDAKGVEGLGYGGRGFHLPNKGIRVKFLGIYVKIDAFGAK